MTEFDTDFSELVAYDRYHSVVRHGQLFSVRCFCSEEPYIGFLENQEDVLTLSAIAYSSAHSQLDILDVVSLPSDWLLGESGKIVTMVWDRKGTRMALLLDHQFKLILDFEEQALYSNLNISASDQQWKLIRLDSQPKILESFQEERRKIQNHQLSELIKQFQETPNHYQRLKLFRAVMTATFLVPISEPETEASHLFLTFPKQDQQILCTFTDLEAAHNTLGTELDYKWVPAQFLFGILPAYDVDSVLLSTSLGNSTLIEAKDFSFLGVLGNKTKQTYSEMAKLLGQFLLNTAQITEALRDLLIEGMKSSDKIQKAYIYESGSQVGTVTVALIMEEEDNTQLVQFYNHLIGKTRACLDQYQHLEIGVLDETTKSLRLAIEENLSPIYVKDTVIV